MKLIRNQSELLVVLVLYDLPIFHSSVRFYGIRMNCFLM
jgi:hypothetical protein